MDDIAGGTLDRVAVGLDPLPRGSVYCSLEGRAEYLAFYDKVLARLPFPHHGKQIATRYGRTHVTIAGNPDGPPLICLPGMSIAGPMMLEFFAPHARDRLLIAPDLIGHPGHSEDRRLPHKKHGFGLWLADLLDGLRLDRADMASASFGSAFALDLATIAPERVGKLALIVPAGLTPRLPYVTFYFPFFLSWLIYRYLPYRPALPAISRPLARSLTEENFDYLDLVIRQTVYYRHRPAGPFFPADLAGYREPVFLVTTGHDNLFPREQTLANARAALNIGEEIFLPDSAHMPGDDDMVGVNERLAAFLAR
jgi:pimeloyl-ACP methyl ester carboxylesterase